MRSLTLYIKTIKTIKIINQGLFDNSRAYIDGLAIQKELVFCRTVLTDNKFELIEIEIIQIK